MHLPFPAQKQCDQQQALKPRCIMTVGLKGRCFEVMMHFGVGYGRQTLALFGLANISWC